MRPPMWSQDGQELFYRMRDDEKTVVVVPVEHGPDLRTGNAEILLGGRYFLPDGFREYDWSPDAQQFLMMKPAAMDSDTPDLTQIILVRNWFDELQRLVPTP